MNFWRVRRFARRPAARSPSGDLSLRAALRPLRGVRLPRPDFRDDLHELARGFDEARALGGHFCLATHHWEIDETMGGVLRRFLNHAAGFPDVRFVAAEDLFR